MRGTCVNYRDMEDIYNAMLCLKREDGQKILERRAMVITSTQSMASEFIESGVFASNCVSDANVLLHTLLENWYSDEVMLAQAIAVSEAGRRVCKNNRGGRRTLAEKNRGELLLGIRLLAEMQVDPEILKKKANGEMKLLADIYSEVLAKESSFGEFRAEINRLMNPTYFKEKLCRLKGIFFEKKLPNGSVEKAIKAVYFQGFYFIRPLQKILMKAFEAVGVPIYFLNNVDREVDYVYDVWQKNSFFRNLPVIELPSTMPKKLKYSDVFSGNSGIGQYKPNASVSCYKDSFSFAKKLTRDYVENKIVLNPQGPEIREFFEKFLPENDVKHSLLSYPVGRYIDSLYKMWNRDKQIVELSIDGVRQCLASGWALKQNDTALIDIFEKAAFYFEDCSDIASWQKRLSHIEDVKRNVVSKFAQNGSSKLHNMMTNPLCNISPFALTDSELDILGEGLRTIVKDVEDIFSGNNNAISKHFKVIEKILKRKTALSDMTEREIDSVNEIIKKLSDNNRLIAECNNDDAAEVVELYISGKLDQKLRRAADEWFIYGISEIEFVNYNLNMKDALLCFCDSLHMPELCDEEPWPLTRKYLRYIADISNAASAELIVDYLYSKESSQLGSRYLFYLAMQHSSIDVSWITSMGGKLFSECAYSEILRNVYEIKLTQNDDILLESTVGSLNSRTAFDITAVKNFNIEKVKELSINKWLCPYRNFYDYVLNEKPIIKSRFLIQFYMSSFLRESQASLYGGHDVINKAAEQMNIVFPIFSSAEQREQLSYARKGVGMLNILGKDEINGLKYHPFRLALKYPYQALKNYSKACKENTVSDGADFDSCIYCPHADKCIKQGWRISNE